MFSWILTCFLYNFSLTSSVLIWDYLLLHSVPIEDENDSKQIGIHFGSGFLNAITLSIKIIDSFSEELLQASDIGQIMEILRHDSLEKYLTPPKVQEIIAKCRAEPCIDWPTFQRLAQQHDPALFSLTTAPSPPSSPPCPSALDSFLSVLRGV